MGLTARDVEEILRYLDASPFDELHLEIDGLSLHVSRSGAGTAPAADGGVAPAAPAPAPAAPAATSPPASVSRAVPAATGAGLVEIRSAFLGTFYRAPKPGEAPFTDIGQRVEPDSVVGIVEVMKLMNSLRAGVAGEVVEICADNGELVEYGQVLFRVRADEA